MESTNMALDARLPEDAFVGRNIELGIVETRIRRAISGRGVACIVIGEAGVGKSRLVDEALHSLSPFEATILQTRCPPDSPPFTPWADLLHDYCSRVGQAEASRIAGRHARRLAHLAPALDRDMATSPNDSPPENESLVQPDSYERRAIDALRAFFTAACKDKPVVLRIEDMQNADSWSFELVQVFCRSIETLPICLLCESRHDGEASLEGAHNYAQIEKIFLEDLSEEHTRIVAETWCGCNLDDGWVARLYRRSGGNPLYLTQLLRRIGPVGSGAALHNASMGAPLPPSIRSLVADRLSGIRDSVMRVLYAAALIGYEFRLDILASPGMFGAKPIRWRQSMNCEPWGFLSTVVILSNADSSMVLCTIRS